MSSYLRLEFGFAAGLASVCTDGSVAGSRVGKAAERPSPMRRWWVGG